MKELLKVLEFTADRTQALADSQSVAGEPLHVGDVTLIPVSSISCGFAGGGSDLPARTRNDAAAAGSGARLAKTPVAFLAVCGQEVQVLTLEQPAKEEKATAPAAESTGTGAEKWNGIAFDDSQIRVIKEAMKQGKNVYGINVVVQDSCILKAARAFLVFKAVEEKGEIIILKGGKDDIIA